MLVYYKWGQNTVVIRVCKRVNAHFVEYIGMRQYADIKDTDLFVVNERTRTENRGSYKFSGGY